MSFVSKEIGIGIFYSFGLSLQVNLLFPSFLFEKDKVNGNIFKESSFLFK